MEHGGGGSSFMQLLICNSIPTTGSSENDYLMTFYFFFSAYVKFWVSRGDTPCGPMEPDVIVCTRLDFHFVVECFYIYFILLYIEAKK